MPERDDLQTGNGTSSVVGSRQWRQVLRDVDELVAGCILIIQVAHRCLIYSMEWEVRQLDCCLDAGVERRRPMGELGRGLQQRRVLF